MTKRFGSPRTGPGLETLLDAKAPDHHADIVIAAAIALHSSNNGPDYTDEGKIPGWWG